MRGQSGILTGSDVLGPEITLVGNYMDFFDIENLSRRPGRRSFKFLSIGSPDRSSS
jgi:hypothetical protein